ncbi:MAG: ABC transporter permease [Thermoplasmata archaeon]
MKMRRILAFTRRTLLQFRHDRRTFAFIIGVPFLMILIFGYTFSGEVTNVKVIFVSHDCELNTSNMPGFPTQNLNLSSSIYEHLDRKTLNLATETDLEKGKRCVEKGEAWGLIYVPENFTENFVQAIIGKNRSAELTLYIDGSNPPITAAIINAITTAIKDALTSAGFNFSQQNPVNLERVYIYGSEDTKFIDYFAPGVMSFAIMIVTTMLTIILFVNERRNGTLQRILTTPAKPEEIVLGYALAFALICMLQSIVIMCAGILLFGIKIAGNILLAFLIFFMIGAGHLGLGILLSAGAKNELQAIQFIPFIIFPSILLAGLFWPVESIPAILQPLAYFIPLRYGIDAERGIMVRGWGIEHIWVDLVILFFFALLTITASTWILRRKE